MSECKDVDSNHQYQSITGTEQKKKTDDEIYGLFETYTICKAAPEEQPSEEKPAEEPAESEEGT